MEIFQRHPWLRYPILLFIVARIALSLWALAVILFVKPPTPIDAARGGSFIFQTIDSGAGSYLLEPWNRYDTHWYIKIAAEGYSPADGSIVYFPLYPILIRIVGTLIDGQWLFAALIVSNLAMLGALIVLYRLVADRFDDAIARWALFALVIFPTAFFFFAAYTESLFILFALLTLRDLQSRYWWRASLFAGLATLTRAPGILLIVPMLYALCVQYRAKQVRFVDGLSIITPIIGAAGFWLYLALFFSDASAWSRGVTRWWMTGFPGQNIVILLQTFLAGNSFGIANQLIDLTLTVFFLGGVIVGFFRLPPLWSIYSVVMILPPLMSMHTVVTQLPLASLPRYGLAAFPIFITLALARIHPRWQMVGVTVALVLQAMFVALFINWIWIA